MACLGPGEAVSPRAADPIAGLDGAIQSDARSEAAAKSHALDIATVASRLEVETEHGLAQSEAAARLRRFGPNALREAPRPGLVALVWEQLDDFLIWLLLAAAAIAATVGYFAGEGFVESIAIIAIVVLNATLGVVQERRAENAMRALDALVAHDIVVLREGERLSVPSAELVPGDIVMLETGNLVPADLRLLESANLRIDEAALTGESVSVRMSAESVAPPQADLGDRVNMAYRGTVVTYGRGAGIVTATGMDTELGKIADLIQSYEREPTPLQESLDELGKSLGKIAVVVSVIVFAVGALERTDVLLLGSDPAAYASTFGSELLELFMVAVTLAIAAVPEGLPAVVTIALAIGMQRMVKRNALIRRLPAVETLGSASTICSDKTGTLTQNEMKVVRADIEGKTFDVGGRGYEPQGDLALDGQRIDPASDPDLQLLAIGAALASDAVLAERDGEWRVVGDPTEGALVAFARRAGRDRQTLSRQLPRIAEIPFDSDRKRMTTVHRVDDARHLPLPDLSPGLIAFTKGAPDNVLELCDRYSHDGRAVPLEPAMRKRVAEAIETMAERALRVLAVAYRVPSPEELGGGDATASDAGAGGSEADGNGPAGADTHFGGADLVPDQLEQGLVLLGLLGMIDPPRPEVAPAIATARSAGIRTLMITGDYPQTAMAVAREVGIAGPDDRAISGAELTAMDDAALEACLADATVFARVAPEHKVRIVEGLKDRGEIVAMTGDGVNDAPALKRAHIGVAMGITGTDVSRETADMVLMDDNYASIVAAVEEGRTIFENIRKFVFYLLSCNIGEILIIFVGMLLGAAGLFGLPLAPALLPIQLLWLNLISDGLPALALGVERAEPDVMSHPPRDPREPVLSRELWPMIAVQAGVDALATLTAFAWAYDGPESLVRAQTIAFTTLVLAELFRAFTARSATRSIFQQGLASNPWMLAATGTSLALHVAVLYTPPLQSVFRTVALDPLAELLPVFGFALLPAAAAEAVKWLRRRIGPPSASKPTGADVRRAYKPSSQSEANAT